jgi:hypothetical protein
MLWLAASLFASAMTLHRPQPEVLFAIRDDSQARDNSPDNLAIEPIAMVTKLPGSCAGCWTLTFGDPAQSPIHDGTKSAAEKEFAAGYFRPGRTYRMLAGGAEVGTVKVVKETDLGCVSLAASVDVRPPPSKGDWNRLRVLAVGSLHVTPRKPVRRWLESAEEKALWSLAERELGTRGVPASLFAEMEGGDFISADLDHDGQRDVIGSFEANDAKARIRHRLFLIAMGDGAGGYRTEYVWYFRFLESANEGRTESVQLVDTIDLDEDGTDEIVVSWGFYESNEYEILKRAGGKWTRVYKGGRSGC